MHLVIYECILIKLFSRPNFSPAIFGEGNAHCVQGAFASELIVGN